MMALRDRLLVQEAVRHLYQNLSVGDRTIDKPNVDGVFEECDDGPFWF